MSFVPSVSRAFFALVVVLVSATLVASSMSGVAWAEGEKALEPVEKPNAASDVPVDTDGDGALDRPDKASAMSTAIVQKKRVEDLSARSESTSTFANPDGSWTIDAFSGPVRALDDAEKWVPLDGDLVDKDGKFAAKSSAYDIAFANGGEQKIASVDSDAGASFGIGWTEDLPPPTVAGDTLTYSNVAGTGDLVVQSKPNGFNYSVVLDKAPAPGSDPVEIRYPLSLGGAKATLAADGSVEIKKGKTKIGSMSAPIMFDSSASDTSSVDAVEDAPGSTGSPAPELPSATSGTTPAPGAGELEPSDPAADADVASGSQGDPKAIETVLERDGDTTTLVLRPDMSFLTDPATVYPLTIDPTFVLASAADTYVQSSGNTNSQLGSTELHVGSPDNGATVARSLIYFDLSNAPALTAASITSASVTASNFATGDCTGTPITMSRITSGWDGAAVTWATQPSVTATGASQSSASYGGLFCLGEGNMVFDATQIYKDWAAGAPAVGVQLRANNETAASGHRKLRSAYNGDAAKVAKLSVTYNGAPNVPTDLQVAPASIDGTTMVTNNTQPTFSAAISDPESGNVTGQFRLVNSSNTVVDSWTSGSVTSGSRVSRKPASALAQGTYTASWRANDGASSSAWSPGMAVKIDTTAPAAPSVSCTAVANGTWYETPPASSTTCTVTTGSDTVRVQVVGADGATLASGVPSSNSFTATLALPANDSAELKFYAYDLAGNGGVTAYSYGIGGGALHQPSTGASGVGGFVVEASSKKDAASAQVQWRKAGDAGWSAATQVKSGASAWSGTPTNSGSIKSTTGVLSWNALGESGVANPSVLDLRVCFNYATAPSQRCTPVSTVNVVPHAFGGSFPTAPIGPAEVSLLSGEYQVDQTDVTVPGFGDEVGLTRTYQSLGTAASPAQGVFGPGWITNLQGPSGGFAAAQVVDNTAIDGSITLLDTDGEAYTYVASTGGNVGQKSDVYVGIGETSTFNEKLEITQAKVLELTEEDGVVTRWSLTSPNIWKIQSVTDPSPVPATTFGYSGDFVRAIYAGIPGIACNDNGQAYGCRWLSLSYTTISGAQRLTKVDLNMPNPSGSGVITRTVQEYGYDSSGRLTSTWDPRETVPPTSSAHLKTQYGYATVNSKVMLSSISPPGQTPWQFNLNINGTLNSVTRAQTAAVGGSAATWRVAYNLPMSGTNLPNLTASEVAKWGQPQAPVNAGAVFGPDASDTTDPRYADVSYWTRDGRTTNTATFGAGTWQIESTGYDAKGQVNWSLDNKSRKTGFEYGWDGPTIGFMLATRTEYSADGTRVERVLGPFRNTVLDNGSAAFVRPVTTNSYDDEVDASLKPGAPTATLGPNEPKRNMLVEQREGLQLPNGAANIDVDITRYRYDKIVSTDGDGWTLKMPTRVSTSLGNGYSTTLTRFDTEGKTIETRTPQGVASTNGAGTDSRSTITKYYTAGANAADSTCGGKSQWVGEVCKVGPAGSSTAPTTATTAYDYLLNATTVTQTSGSMVRTIATEYDIAGRKTQDSTSVTGAASGDLPIAGTTYAYSPSSGALTTTTTAGVSITTDYDAWGRVTSTTDGTGNTAVTTYNAAGRVKTLDDGKGIYTYTYDGIDSLGKLERRGLVTKLDVGLASGPDEFSVAYDDDGNQLQVVYPNGIKADSAYDTVGNRTTLAYSRDGTSIASFVNYVDAEGRTKAEQSLMSLSYYTYDGRDRLVKSKDTVFGNCTTRDYTFSLDSNRESLQTYAPGSDGACTTTTPAIKGSTFDVDDRITNAGYTYDALGRTRTLPAVDTDKPTGSAATVNYYANDMVAKISQQVPAGGSALEKSYGLDAFQRLSTMSSKTDGTELRKTVNHYSDNSDSPAWIETQTRPNFLLGFTTTWSRNIQGPDGDLSIIQSSDGSSRVQLTDMRGSIIATLPNTTAAYAGLENYSESDEYGNTKANGYPLNQDYKWLGDKRRSTDTLGGFTLMGARLYNPTTGRFLSRDPVSGGNDNTYTYPVDPINLTDLDGQFGISFKGIKNNLKKNWKTYASVASIAIPGVGAIGTAYRTYKLVRAIRSSTGMAGRLTSRNTRLESHIAGRIHVGRGSRAMSNGGGRISKDGLRAFRKPTPKKRSGRIQSNFERRDVPRGRFGNNYHANHNKYKPKHRK